MGKLKVLILGKLPPPYIGPSIATKIILNSRLKEEFDPIHLDTSDHRDINTLGAFDFWNFYLAFKHYFTLVWFIIARWPAIIYMPVGQTTISYIRDSVFILIAKVFHRKVVCHLRGGNFKNWYNSASPLIKWFVQHIHPLVDGQIVLGNNLKCSFNWLIPEEKIYVIPNGRDFNFQYNEEVKKIPRELKILFLANFHKTKGVIDVLKSVLKVYKTNSNVGFIFAGSWRDKETKKEFENFINKYPYLPITISGIVTKHEKYQLFSSSDIFIFPTYYPNEGHPWVIVEAMAFGLPIISTDQGAITESVINGFNGFIIEKRNHNQIAENIRILIENPAIRKKMGQASFQHYLENFTEKKMVERFISCFNSVLK